MEPSEASFRFYAELCDFLSPLKRRGQERHKPFLRADRRREGERRGQERPTPFLRDGERQKERRGREWQTPFSQDQARRGQERHKPFLRADRRREGERRGQEGHGPFLQEAERREAERREERWPAEMTFRFHVPPTVKDAIESLGVPHVEVDLILVNGVSVDFAHRLADGDRVSVYPVFESLDIGPVVRLRPAPLRRTAFVADVHLRRLARLLRLLGFDVRYADDLDDVALIDISVEERRILLTRDRQLLKHGRLTHATWIRSTDPIEQACEVVRRFDLAGSAKPFSRCPACNGFLEAVDKATVADEIPPKTARWLDEYVRCNGCGKLYWRGTHFARLEGLVGRILGEDAQA